MRIQCQRKKTTLILRDETGLPLAIKHYIWRYIIAMWREARHNLETQKFYFATF